MALRFTVFVFMCAACCVQYSVSQITSAQSGAWSAATTWAGGVVPSDTDDVVIATGHVVTLDSSAAVCRDLTINGSGGQVRFAIDGTSSTLTVHGNITIDAGGKLAVTSRSPAGAANSYLQHTLTIEGDLTNKGTLDLRGGSTSGGTSNGVLTVFSGTATSTISLLNTVYKSSAEEFNGITIKKSNGARVVLASGNLFMNSSSSVGPSVLTFVSGTVVTDTNRWVVTATSSSSVTGASDSSYIIGVMGRGMNSSGETEKKFEIGDSSGYRPIIIRTTTGGKASGHYVFAGLVQGRADDGASTLNGDLDSVSSIRYYTIGYSKGGVAGSVDSMSFKQFSPFYREDDGVQQGMLGVMVAYSTDERTTWNNIGPSNHVGDLSIPPTELQSDAISPELVLHDGGTMNVSLAFGTGEVTGPLPDIANGKYGPHPLQSFDLWKATSATPTPLVIRIHGGGLTSGSKADISMTFVSLLLSKGISVMSINYRLSPEVVVPQHYLDCARAIQYVRLHAEELNIDSDNIAATGSSAGALTSFWIAFHDDLADPGNADSVLRMSSRLKGVACWSGQTTVDKRVALAWIGPVVLDFTSYFKGTIFGLPADSMDTPTAYALQEMASPVNHLTADDPPAWMYYSYVDPPANSSEAIHHVNFGIHLKEKMDSLGIDATLLTPSFTGSINESAADFFSGIFEETDTTATGLRDASMRARNFALEQNYPNPFNPGTVIRYSLPEAGFTTLTVYDVTGREVAKLVNGRINAGMHEVRFEAPTVSSGMYLCRLRSGAFTAVKKMLFVR